MYWNDLLDLTFVESIWADAVNIDETMLDSLFTAANELCVAYAPLVVAGSSVPERYKHAEILMARHLWQQANGGNAQEFGEEGYAPVSYPLVFAARDLLRPKASPLSKLGRRIL